MRVVIRRNIVVVVFVVCGVVISKNAFLNYVYIVYNIKLHES
jgi:hypothetical protein